jgi:hypothetical protein
MPASNRGIAGKGKKGQSNMESPNGNIFGLVVAGVAPAILPKPTKKWPGAEKP